MRRALPLLAACAVSFGAAAGWVKIGIDAIPVVVTGIRSGCVAPGQYERPITPVPVATSTVTIQGLPDSGKCYFAPNTGPQDELVADFTALTFNHALPGPVGNLTVTWAPTPPAPAFSKGFDFRATSGYVVDAAGDTYVTGDVYPTTRNGVTFGWEATFPEPRDRSAAASFAPRLAGINQLVSGGATLERVFRIDLPAPGTYQIRLAAGDATVGNRAFFEVRDGTTVLFSRAELAVPAGQFVDASGVLRASAAAWTSSNVPMQRTFASTIARFVLKRPSQAGSVIAHLQVEVVP